MDPAILEPAGTRLIAAFRHDVLHDAPLPCTALHGDDPMLRFFVGQRRGHREAALVDYLATGLSAADAVDAVLRWRFGDRHHDVRLLDFASGYGRVTRFLAQRLSPRHIWTSDLLAGAVDFQRRHLGVHAFVSVTDPERLACAETFDAITVASLFSHLPPAMFEPWLRRLWALLRPGGVLMFSVHDSRHAPAAARPPAGQRFDASSEIDELPGERYGTSWVDEGFVRGAVAAATGASCLRVPDGLWALQDVYLVCHGDSPAAPPRWRQSRGFLERAQRTGAGDLLLIDGWFHDPRQREGSEPACVRVRLDGTTIAEIPVELPRRDVIGLVGESGLHSGWASDLRLPGGLAGETMLSVVGVGRSGETLLHLGSVESTELNLGLGHQVSLLSSEIDRMRMSRFWKLRDAWWAVRGRLLRRRALAAARAARAASV